MKYDAVIIGFGKGGKTLAGKLAKTGKSVALIEKDPNMYGGTCINVGCIPSKSLIHSAASANPYGDAAEKLGQRGNAADWFQYLNRDTDAAAVSPAFQPAVSPDPHSGSDRQFADH